MMVESSLPFFLILLPMFGALFVLAFGRYEKTRNGIVVATTTSTLLLSGVLLFLAKDQGVSFCLPWFLGFGLWCRVDFISAVFSFVVALVWFLASVFALEYMKKEHNQTRFFAFFTFTLGACLGVFLAGDLFSLFLFFELMTFAAYVLVIHEEDKAALSAGNTYLYMSVFGGLALLFAVFILHHTTGTTAFTPLLDTLVANSVSPYLLLFLLACGFGVKAGMLPLHIWLPKAHPVAPSPASALLSALMIKAGAYGFLRSFLTILTTDTKELLFYTETFGIFFMVIGALTMILGALMGIQNRSMKKILAYSSISQMGYILVALGVAIYLGYRGAFGFAGAWMHMINHALFKSLFFLLAGAVYLKTHELDLDKLSGLRKKMPFAFLFMLIAAGGITGIPGLNGYVSKVLIHEAILEAYHIRELPAFLILEKLFILTGGLTVAYISKLWMGIFLGKEKEEWSHVKDISRTHKGVFAAYAVLLLGIGVFAQGVVNRLVTPATSGYSFYGKDVLHLGEVPFWKSKELAGPVLAYVIGLSVLALFTRFGHRIRVPHFVSVEYLFYGPLVRVGHKVISWVAEFHAPRIDFDRLREMMADKTFSMSKFAKEAVQNRRPKKREKENVPIPLKKAMEKAKLETTSTRVEKEDAYWSTNNISFDSLILALVIAIFLLIFLSIGF